jgi:hypothetical protein
MDLKVDPISLESWSLNTSLGMNERASQGDLQKIVSIFSELDKLKTCRDISGDCAELKVIIVLPSPYCNILTKKH